MTNKKGVIGLLQIKKVVRVNALEEAYTLNQKKMNVLMGGLMWLRMGKRTIDTGIDLSGLGLNTLMETDTEFQIGCMCTLRDLETHEGLNASFQGTFKKALHHIVGVQFRNGATVGGTIYGRYGFSDLLTLLLALDTEVELYKGGIVPLREFVQQKKDPDILVAIHVKKDGRVVSYQSQQNNNSDFPLIAVAVSKKEDAFHVAVGARPLRAGVVEKAEVQLSENSTEQETEAFAEWATNQFEYGTNMRATGEYRKHLAFVYIKRACMDVLKGVDVK